jgi:hypothetical protein
MTTAEQERLVDIEAVDVPVAERPPVGAEKTFRAYDPDQVLMMAPVLRDWVPDGIWRISSRIWSTVARWICRRSTPTTPRSAGFRRMTRG